MTHCSASLRYPSADLFAWHHPLAHDRLGHHAGANRAQTNLNIVIDNVRQELQRILIDPRQQRDHPGQIRAIGASGDSNAAAACALSAPHRALGFHDRERLVMSWHIID